jgi:16S rRNA (guanine1516-N2)-methyltransferase
LASQLNLPLVDSNQVNHSFPFLLAVTPERLELRENAAKHAKPIFVDFLTPKLNYRIKNGGGKKQLIAKAIGVKNGKNLAVIDATAGFGIDSFILASLGCDVTMLERSPIIGALLKDGLKRLNKNMKISLHVIQSLDYINKISQYDSKKPDVIYLDPMYPTRPKSALNKKIMRVLHELVGDDNDAPKLLEAALRCAKKRVVVKRPKYADYLGDLKPDLQFSSSGSCRYDVYLIENRRNNVPDRN